MTRVVYPNNGPTITNIYDIGGNLSKVQQLGGSGTAFYQATSFTPLDQVAGITYGNGVTATQSYYANSHRLHAVTTSGSLQSLTYTYDAVSDIASISDGVYGGASSASISSVSYDDLHRLLSFTRPGTGQTVSCTYDSVGNMTLDSENGSGAYTYGPSAGRLPHAVESANGVYYAYDPAGNMVVRGNQQLFYDADNRLTNVVTPTGNVTFGYDGSGARLWKQGAATNTLQVWIGGNYEEKDGKILFHISAGDRVVCTFDAASTVFEYYHPDHLHSAEILSTSSGGLYQHYEYSAYGQGRYTNSGTAFPISRRYTSQVLDEETGLYFYGARYYDPVLGRFIQPDGLITEEFNPQAYDRYAYALDNPLRFVDPSGHAGKEAADWWAGIVNSVFLNLTAGSQSSVYIGTMGTANTLVGGLADPLRLGSDAGRLSATGGTPGEIAGAALTELGRAAALVPVGAAIGKGTEVVADSLVSTGGEEALTATATSRAGVDLTLKYKPGWSASQRAAADAKAAALTEADTTVVKSPAREGSAQAKYRKAAGLDSNTDADHIVDLQLGGKDSIDNVQGLDKSVNRSLGAQIHHQTQDLKEGTVINNVIIEEQNQ